MKKTRKAKKEVPVPQDKPKHAGGRKSLITIMLDENPGFKKTLIENEQKIATDPESIGKVIETLEDLFLYMQFELTRSRNTDLLRGKTLTEYSREFINVFKAIEHSKELEADLRIKIETARRNREEVEEFMKFAIDAIANKVQDINLRKDISQEIKNLYEKKYSSEPRTIINTTGDTTPTSST